MLRVLAEGLSRRGRAVAALALGGAVTAAACGFAGLATERDGARPSSGDGGGEGGLRVVPDASAPGADGATGADADADAGPCKTRCAGVCRARTDCNDCVGATIACSNGATATCVSTCQGCAAGGMRCNGATTTSCVASCQASCGLARVGCMQCPASGVMIGSCELPVGAYCLAGLYPHCTCPGGSTSECAAANAVCSNNVCKACGEGNTDGNACKDGKSCNAMDQNPADLYLCR